MYTTCEFRKVLDLWYIRTGIELRLILHIEYLKVWLIENNLVIIWGRLSIIVYLTTIVLTLKPGLSSSSEHKTTIHTSIQSFFSVPY